MTNPPSLHPAGEPRHAATVVVALGVLLYVVATAITTWGFIGDAPDYARSALSQFQAGDCLFLEFGHLLWRPTGYSLIALTSGGTTPGGSSEEWLHALALLNGAAWMAGLVAVAAIGAWLHRVTKSAAAALVGVATFVFVKAFLNFAHAGTSYVPALACLVLALWFGSLPGKSAGRVATSILAGVALAGSMLYWATFVFAAPAVLLAPLVLFDDWRGRLRWVVLSGASCTLLMLGVYAWAGSVLDLRTIADYREWVGQSQHGIAIGGIGRAAVGLARFVVDLGDYGTQVKRHLLNDPFNPVSRGQLLNIDLAKFLGVYLFALVCAVLAWRGPKGTRVVLFFLASLAPTTAFGVFWQGGDLERYLPALPAIALLVAQAFRAQDGSRRARSVIGVGVCCIAVANLSVLLTPVVRREREASLRRLSGVPEAAIARDLFVVSHWHDPLMATVRDDPFDATVRSGLTLYPLVTFGTPQVDEWREQFERRVIDAWAKGERVWISRRLFAERPGSDWGWNEGDDRRIAWPDLFDYFGSFTYEDGGEASARDFVVMPDVSVNRSLLVRSGSAAGRVGGAQSSCKRVKIFGPKSAS